MPSERSANQQQQQQQSQQSQQPPQPSQRFASVSWVEKRVFLYKNNDFFFSLKASKAATASTPTNSVSIGCSCCCGRIPCNTQPIDTTATECIDNITSDGTVDSLNTKQADTKWPCKWRFAHPDSGPIANTQHNTVNIMLIATESQLQLANECEASTWRPWSTY